MHQLKITNMPPGRGQLTGFYSIYLGVSFLYYTKPTTLSSSLLNSYRGSYDVELMITHRIVLHNQIWGHPYRLMPPSTTGGTEAISELRFFFSTLPCHPKQFQNKKSAI
jgi:hypothetical protein